MCGPFSLFVFFIIRSYSKRFSYGHFSIFLCKCIFTKEQKPLLGTSSRTQLFFFSYHAFPREQHPLARNADPRRTVVWHRFEGICRSCWDHFVNMLGLSLGHVEVILVANWGQLGSMLGYVWEMPGPC